MHTHAIKVGLPFAPEVPFDGGGRLHLAPPLAGEAAQFEAFARDRLGVRVRLCTGPTAVCCENQDKRSRLWLNMLQQHITEAVGGLTQRAAEESNENHVQHPHVHRMLEGLFM